MVTLYNFVFCVVVAGNSFSYKKHHDYISRKIQLITTFEQENEEKSIFVLSRHRLREDVCDRSPFPGSASVTGASAHVWIALWSIISSREKKGGDLLDPGGRGASAENSDGLKMILIPWDIK